MKKMSLCVIGSPIEHSLSPIIHRVAIEESKLPYTYEKVEVRRDTLASFICEAKSKYRGFNVTLPHKVSIMPLLDDLEEKARKIGSINTVVREGKRLIGFNTDSYGFLFGLDKQNFCAEDKNVVIFGAGGAARAVVFALREARSKKITLGIRDMKKRDFIKESFKNIFPVEVYFYQAENLFQELKEADLIVNATPVGMHPYVEDSISLPFEMVKNKALFYDLIYSPRETRFLKTAKMHGHKIINGAYMLIGQAKEAFRLFTGYEADEGAMLAALEEQLKQPSQKDEQVSR